MLGLLIWLGRCDISGHPRYHIVTSGHEKLQCAPSDSILPLNTLKDERLKLARIDSSWIFLVNGDRLKVGSTNSSPFDYWSFRCISTKR